MNTSNVESVAQYPVGTKIVDQTYGTGMIVAIDDDVMIYLVKFNKMHGDLHSGRHPNDSAWEDRCWFFSHDEIHDRIPLPNIFKQIVTVEDLIEALSYCDLDLPVFMATENTCRLGFIAVEKETFLVNSAGRAYEEYPGKEGTQNCIKLCEYVGKC